MNRMQIGRGATLVKTLALAVAAVVVLGGTGVVLWSRSSAGAASSGYQEKRQALATQLAAASQQGYTASDLAPVTSQVGRLDSSSEPWWLPGRAGYFQAQAAQAGALQGQLTALEQGLKDQARADAGRQTDAIKAAIAQAQQANADDLDVQSLQQRLDAVSRAQGAAHTLKDYRAAASQAQSVAQDAATLLTSTQQENQQLAQAAQQLATQSGGNLGAMQQAGNQAVFNANNDASVIAYLSREGPFKGADTVARIASRLSKFAGLVGSGDPGQAALGAAAAQRYAGQIHDALMAGLPAKSVIVSFQAQHAWAYEGSNVVMDNAVTTGIRVRHAGPRRGCGDRRAGAAPG